jgi:hypothetical protein
MTRPDFCLDTANPSRRRITARPTFLTPRIRVEYTN